MCKENPQGLEVGKDRFGVQPMSWDGTETHIKKGNKMSDMDIKLAYKTMQAASGIEVGDTVKVIRRFERAEMGSDCASWNNVAVKAPMQGKELVVSEVCTGHIWVDGWSFPFFALELIKKADKSKMITINGKDWSEDTIAEALRKHAE